MIFDTKQFLEDHGIEYTQSGKNATRGWVQIHCPFPDCHDSSNHMGIAIKTGIFHCWICDRKGPIYKLIARLLKISFDQAEEIAKKYTTFDLGEEPPETKGVEQIKVKGFLENTLLEQHRNYLIQRNFDPDKLIHDYRLGSFGIWGRFSLRIAIPVYENRRLINMTARDITGEQQSRYLSLKNEEAVVPIKSCVYNIDRAGHDNILIVEGPFDVWRMGGHTVSFFGTTFKTEQILKVVALNPKKIFILFDQGAEEHASKLAYQFAPLIKQVELLYIDSKDPADLSQKEADEIRAEIKI